MYLKKCSEPQNSEEIIAAAGELVERSHKVLDRVGKVHPNQP